MITIGRDDINFYTICYVSYDVLWELTPKRDNCALNLSSPDRADINTAVVWLQLWDMIQDINFILTTYTTNVRDLVFLNSPYYFTFTYKTK